MRRREGRQLIAAEVGGVVLVAHPAEIVGVLVQPFAQHLRALIIGRGKDLLLAERIPDDDARHAGAGRAGDVLEIELARRQVDRADQLAVHVNVRGRGRVHHAGKALGGERHEIRVDLEILAVADAAERHDAAERTAARDDVAERRAGEVVPVVEGQTRGASRHRPARQECQVIVEERMAEACPLLGEETGRRQGRAGGRGVYRIIDERARRLRSR